MKPISIRPIKLAHAWIAAFAAVVMGTGAHAGDPVAGKKHYVSICAACHGIDGIPSLRYAPSFAHGERLDRDDAELIVSVRDGIFFMPPWGGYLTEAQIADAIAYARTLRKPDASTPRQ